MKTQIKFRNAEGQFCKSNQNFGFLIETETWKISAYRAGQCEPHCSNNVRVVVDVRSNNFLRFNAKIFKENLCENYDKYFRYVYFTAKTYREAFLLAKEYINIELEKYDVLVQKRALALQNAEL